MSRSALPVTSEGARGKPALLTVGAARRVLAPALTGALVAAALGGAAEAPSQPPPLSIRSSQPVVVYGGKIDVSGVLRGRPAGTPVTVYVRRHGEAAFAPVNAADTDAGGAWSYSFEPTIRSWVRARAGDLTSATVTVRVRPRLTLGRRGESLLARAVAARSFRGRYVWFQRRSGDAWRSVRKVVLDDPPRRFRARLPGGVSRVRVSLPRAQAGPGYEPAVSRPVLLRR
jgi:hypothetical protein